MQMRTNDRSSLDLDGYVVRENVFSAKELAVFSLELDMAIQRSHFENEAYLEEDGASVFLVGDLSRCSSYWADLKNFKPVTDWAFDFLEDETFELEFIQALIKHPKANRKVNWHRDFPNKAIPRADSRSVRILLCLDSQTEENGGIRIIKNSHLVSDQEARQHRPSKEKNWSKEDEFTLACPAGSLIALHSKIVHGGRENLSVNPRRVITFSWSHSANAIAGNAETYSMLGFKPRLQPEY